MQSLTGNNDSGPYSSILKTASGFPARKLLIQRGGRKYSKLVPEHREQILNYDLSVVELKNDSEKDIRDIFVRMNKYVVKLNPAELRHAHDEGAFKLFVEGLADLPVWGDL